MTNVRQRAPRHFVGCPRWNAAVFLLVIGTRSPGEAIQGTRTARRLGTVEILSGPVHCEGGACYDIQVSCPEVVAPARARLKVGAPGGGSPRGTVLFTTGGLGTGTYEANHANLPIARLL
jgi:hypothetical protein